MSALARLPALRFFAVIVLLLLTVGATVQSLDLPLGIWVTQLGLFLAPALLFAWACNLWPAQFLRLRRGLAPGLLLLVFLASVANYVVASGLMALMEMVVPERWPRIDAAKVLELEAGFRLAVVIAGVVLAAPLCEEAAFRGFMQQPLMARLGPAVGIGVTALCFSALHLDPVGFLPRIELGIFFGWLLWRTGSLWAPVLAHLVNNGVATLLYVTVGRSEAAAEARLDAEPTGPAILGLVAIGLLALVPLLVAIHRQTAGVAVADGAPDAPVDPEKPVGLNPEASAFLNLMIGLAILALALLLVVGALVGNGGEPA
jgi:uncharacterized protein